MSGVPRLSRMARLTVTDPTVRLPRRPRRSPERHPDDTVTITVDATVMRVAKRLAGGDLARLIILHDGAVVVANSPEHRRALSARLTQRTDPS
ncbi:hypothetical protein [Sinomonas sp. R1AF57]|uniref:hypothetical protein n=1 Tax=Sinomonas sp. R1AF57 TaxID=2020377 RepID=UPI000B61EE23|nr:hypothetical protein [Sinomonas sp. R1AF57]ASN52495.1 hypothetical protein CGQ25_10760 [Sinomonas sp. R1AF57]